MARNDVYLYTNATSPADAVVTAQQNTTTTDFPDLVVGDAPSFNFYFTDGSGSWPSFAGSGDYTVQWSIGDTVAGDEPPLAFQTQATPITGGWTIRLPLSTGPLINRLRATRVSQEFPVVRLWQQLRVLDSDGNPVTYALIRTNVRLRSTPDTAPTSDSPLPSGTYPVLVDASGVLVSPTNFFEANTQPHVFASLYYFGQATDEQAFGYFRSPVALTILGVQISAQTAPTGSDLTIDLVDSSGSELSLVSTLAAGAAYQSTTFGTGYSLAANSFVRAKIKSVGSTIPGGYLTLQILARVADTADTGYAFPVSVFFGTATDEQTFGYFQSRVDTQILGVALSAQVAPVGSALTVDLISSSGTELGQVATLAAGATYQATDYSTPTNLTASDWVRLRIKSVGSSTPGAYLTATLITRPTP